jgi:hypothetical protein
MLARLQPEVNHTGGLALDRNRQLLRELLDRINIAEAVRRRAVQQAISDALPETWRRRAQDFWAAATQPGDWPGQARLSELAGSASPLHVPARLTLCCWPRATRGQRTRPSVTSSSLSSPKGGRPTSRA